MDFVKDRNRIGSLHILRKEIEEILHPGELFIPWKLRLTQRGRSNHDSYA
jgi:hypothetical protein